MNDGGAGIGALADSLMAWGQTKMDDDRRLKLETERDAKNEANRIKLQKEEFNNKYRGTRVNDDGSISAQLLDADGNVLSDITPEGMAQLDLQDKMQGLVNSKARNESDARKLAAEKAQYNKFIAGGGKDEDFLMYQEDQEFDRDTSRLGRRKESLISMGLMKDPTTSGSGKGGGKGLSATPAEKKFAIALASGSDKSTYATNGVDRLGANDILLSMYPDEPGIKLRELQKRQAAGDPKAIAFWNALAKKKVKAGKASKATGGGAAKAAEIRNRVSN